MVVDANCVPRAHLALGDPLPLPATLPTHCATWPSERSSSSSSSSGGGGGGDGDGSSSGGGTSALVASLASHWLRPLWAEPSLSSATAWLLGAADASGRVGGARHEGERRPTVPVDPGASHDGCLGCTGWARAVVLSVRARRLYVYAPPTNPLRDHVTLSAASRCGRATPSVESRAGAGAGAAAEEGGGGADGDAAVHVAWHGASMNARLLTVLRMLRLALQRGEGGGVGGRDDDDSGDGAWPDFDARLSLDDACHGRLDGAASPLLSMAACDGAPTLPLVQWNAIGGREVELSQLDEELRRGGRLRAQLAKGWECRRPVAAWRGEAHAEYGVVAPLPSSGRTTAPAARFERINADGNGTWRRQGRFALVWQACLHPAMLDVRVDARADLSASLRALRRAGLRAPPAAFRSGSEGGGGEGGGGDGGGSEGGGSEGGGDGGGASAVDAAAFESCLRKAHAHPARQSMAQQAAAVQMVVYVEGSGGWADRLRGLLLSGMVVLKQATVAHQWFEPALRPYEHYVPVSRTLHNLTAAIRWVRANAARAQAIVAAGAELAAQLHASDALVGYTAALFRGYAKLQQQRLHPPRVLPRLGRWHARFECDDEGAAGMACGFSAARGNGTRSAGLLDALLRT